MIWALMRTLGGTWTNAPHLRNVEQVKFGTFYPGGLYGVASFFVPHAGATPFVARGETYEVRLFWGLVMVWQGLITDLEEVRGAQIGTRVSAVGHWGGLLGKRTIQKPWADERLDQERWQWTTTASGAEKCTFDRQNRLRFTPKAEAWLNGELAQVAYFAPTGQTVKRVTFNYDFQEAAQAWELQVHDGTSSLWSVTTSGTGSQDITLGTPTDILRLRWYARANQTPPSDGTIYGQITSVVVYTETGSINLTEIAKDVRALVTELSANEHLIASNTYSLVPFVTNNREYLHTLLDRAAGYGDSSQMPWAVGLRGAHLSGDDKPVLFAEAQPNLATVTPDYQVSMYGAEFAARRNPGEVWNWIVVQYKDSRGFTQIVSPDDDGTLTDADSVAAYGRREIPLDIQHGGLTVAVNYARRFLAKWKQPNYAITSPVRVTGYIRKADGGYLPAALVQAGKVLRVTDFLPDLSGAGLLLLITGTTYDDKSQTVDLAFGVPDALSLALAGTGKPDVGTGTGSPVGLGT